MNVLMKLVFLMVVVLPFVTMASLEVTKDRLDDYRNEVITAMKKIDVPQATDVKVSKKDESVKFQISPNEDVNDFDYGVEPKHAKFIQNVFQSTLTPYQEAILERYRFKDYLKIIYDRSHRSYAQQIGAKPIVDSIRDQDQDQYNNDGNPSLLVGKKIIQAAQKGSVVVNNIIDIPFNFLERTKSNLNEKINELSSNAGL